VSVLRICYPDTVRDAASDLLTAVKGTSESVKACTTIDAQVKTTWGAWSDDVEAWLSKEIDSPSWLGLGSQMDQIETYTLELLRWQKTLNGYCDNVISPVVDPTQVPASQDWWKSALEWTVVGVVTVGVAYTVGQVVQLIPKPVPGAPRGPSLLDRGRAHVARLRARAA
jgi:hypothetical protein